MPLEKRGLDAERGCNFISVIVIVASVGSLIYFFASGGNPEVKNFRNACYDRYLRKFDYNPSDDTKTYIAIQCENELKEHLRLRRENQP